MASPPATMSDRLGALPDSILTHLLSFLPTKTCVATSILSRRWRYLWEHVPVLDLYSQNQHSISRVLLLHKLERLDSFRLSFQNDDSHIRQIEAWVITAIDRNVRKFDLSLYIFFMLPSPLFTCETLVDLRLGFCGVAPTNNLPAERLPRLKKLCLEFFKFEAEEFLPRLLSGCPVIEELEIQVLVCKHLVRCDISSPTLKKLVLLVTLVNSLSNDYRVKMNTPALEHLYVDDHEHIESGPLPSLTKAQYKFTYTGEMEDALGYYTSVLSFVDRLSYVESLEIYLLCFIKDIDSLLAAWTVSFSNLTKLKLFARSRFLPKFLESADNLQFLHFNECRHDRMEMDAWIEPQRVPTCLMSHLRTIRLAGLCGVDDEFEMIRYLLENALVLERMEISHHSINETATMFERVSLFERGSKTCQIIFSV